MHTQQGERGDISHPLQALRVFRAERCISFHRQLRLLPAPSPATGSRSTNPAWHGPQGEEEEHQNLRLQEEEE